MFKYLWVFIFDMVIGGTIPRDEGVKKKSLVNTLFKKNLLEGTDTNRWFVYLMLGASISLASGIYFFKSVLDPAEARFEKSKHIEFTRSFREDEAFREYVISYRKALRERVIVLPQTSGTTENQIENLLSSMKLVDSMRYD